MLVNVDI